MTVSNNPKRLVVACLNGAAASSRVGGRLFFSDVVKKILLDFWDTPGKIPGTFYNFMYGKGGVLRSGRRNIRRFILEHNRPQNTLILCGKSYGGWNIAGLLRKLHPRLKYRAVHLILVDACWIGKMLNPLLKIRVPQVDAIKNYFQRNNIFLNGGRIEKTNLIGGSCIEWNLSNFHVCGDRVDHWNIIFHPSIKISLQHSIERLYMALL